MSNYSYNLAPSNIQSLKSTIENQNVSSKKQESTIHGHIFSIEKKSSKGQSLGFFNAYVEVKAKLTVFEKTINIFTGRYKKLELENSGSSPAEKQMIKTKYYIDTKSFTFQQNKLELKPNTQNLIIQSNELRGVLAGNNFLKFYEKFSEYSSDFYRLTPGAIDDAGAPYDAFIKVLSPNELKNLSSHLARYNKMAEQKPLFYDAPILHHNYQFSAALDRINTVIA
jgi:hypothetical protein